MKKVLTLALLLAVGLKGLAQEQKKFYQFKTTIISEATNNFAGGISRGANFNGRTGVAFGLNLEEAKLLKGGYFYAQGFAAYSGSPSSTQIGDIQPISRIETTNRTTLFELWYSQKIGALELLVGQHDMNGAFGVNSLSGEFINTSFGIFPSVALQTPLSIYPAASSAAKAKIALGKQLVLQAALYDGKPLSQEENPHNVKRDWKLFDKLFSITELAYTPATDKAHKSSYKLGAFYTNAPGVSILDSVRQEKVRGIYTTIEQQLYSTETRSLAAFFQAGGTAGSQNLTDLYVSTGLSLKGLCPSLEDALSLGLAYSSLNNSLVEQHPHRFTHYRALLELTYKAKFNEHFSIQPDLQYIINPGAAAHTKNVFAGMLRFTINY